MGWGEVGGVAGLATCFVRWYDFVLAGRTELIALVGMSNLVLSHNEFIFIWKLEGLGFENQGKESNHHENEMNSGSNCSPHAALGSISNN